MIVWPDSFSFLVNKMKFNYHSCAARFGLLRSNILVVMTDLFSFKFMLAEYERVCIQYSVPLDWEARIIEAFMGNAFFTCLSVSTFSMPVHTYTYMCACVHTCGGQSSASDGVLQVLSTLFVVLLLFPVKILRHCLTVLLWLAWNLLCIPCWPWTQRSPCLCL